MSDDFAARRAAARERLNALDPHMTPGGVEADPFRRDWFEAVYALANDDAAAVPWGNLAPHPLLAEFLANRDLSGRRALDVGCGLGDNAEALASAGADATAFDLVEKAVDWARRRFPASPVTYRVADLFAPPVEWRGAFDFVNECYTLQAVPEAVLPQAAAALASLVAPGGELLVIARARADDASAFGPPWPLTRGAMERLAVGGLAFSKFEDIPATDTRSRHWRALLKKAA